MLPFIVSIAALELVWHISQSMKRQSNEDTLVTLTNNAFSWPFDSLKHCVYKFLLLVTIFLPGTQDTIMVIFIVLPVASENHYCPSFKDFKLVIVLWKKW